MAPASQDLDPIGALLRDIRHVPVPNREEQLRLAKAVAAGDAGARDAMLVANLRLVVKMAQRFAGPGVEAADLVQEGVFGLMRAVEKYRFERGYQFSTYATWWVRQAMQRAVESHHTIRLPDGVAALRAKLAREVPAMARELGRPPTDDEVRERLAVTPGRLARAVEAAGVVASLDQPLGCDGDEVPLGSAVGSDDEGFSEVEDRLVGAGLRAVVDRLPEPDRSVVRLRFGFDGDEPASYATVARRLGCSVRRVRRCEERALAALGVDAAAAAARAA